RKSASIPDTNRRNTASLNASTKRLRLIQDRKKLPQIRKKSPESAAGSVTWIPPSDGLRKNRTGMAEANRRFPTPISSSRARKKKQSRLEAKRHRHPESRANTMPTRKSRLKSRPFRPRPSRRSMNWKRLMRLTRNQKLFLGKAAKRLKKRYFNQNPKKNSWKNLRILSPSSTNSPTTSTRISKKSSRCAAGHRAMAGAAAASAAVPGVRAWGGPNR